MNKYIPITPHPKQQFFLLLNHLPEVFFGGAAGPGKSLALLISSLQYVLEPEYKALILRKTYTDLDQPGGLMDEARNWLYDSDAKWNNTQHRWTFPSGASLTFGYLDSANSHFRYQGGGYHFIGIDELTQIPEYQYVFLFSRQRRLKGSNIPIRMRSTSNPGGVYHSWVKARFVDDHTDKERYFVRATFLDNPSLDTDQYRKTLARLSPLDRARYQEGDWDVTLSGGKFKKEWFKYIEFSQLPKDIKFVRYWDMAATPVDDFNPSSDPDYTAGCKVGIHKGVYYVVDMVRHRDTPMKSENLVKRTAEKDGKRVAIWMEQEPGSSGVSVIDHFRRIVLIGYTFRGDRVTGDKESYADPIASAAEAGNVILVRGPWNEDFVDELEAFSTEGVHDDQVDAFVKGCHKTLVGGFKVY